MKEKQREWMKDYEGNFYSIAENGKHKMKWSTEKKYYKDENFSEDKNMLSRKKDRFRIEFDKVEGEPDNARIGLEKTKKILTHYGIGFIQSTHKSPNSDYLWGEFTRDITTDEAKNFLKWICPEGHRIDLNFCSDNKVFPVLIAYHWKYSDERELPVDFLKGRKIDLDSAKIPLMEGGITKKTSEDGFVYENYVGGAKRKGVEKILIITYNKEGKEVSRRVDIDIVSDYLIDKHNFKTWFGVKSDYSFNWNGKFFENDTRGIVKYECEVLLKKYCKRSLVDEIFEKIKRKTKIDKKKFEETNPKFINLENGIWDIEGKKLIPHNPKYNFRYIIEITKDDDPLNVHNCPNWLNFINETLYSDDILVLQEWFGFMLYVEYFIKKAVIFVGQRDTGKSVLLDSAIKFIGDKNKTGLSLQKISFGSDFTKLSLKNKHLNAYDDLSSTDINDGGAFKVATGGGWISGEEKFGEYQQFRSFAKLMFATNKIPPVKDNDDLAYFGRWIVFKFDNIPEKLDPFLREKLWTKKEMSGILNWALEGLYRLLENGCFSYNKKPEQIKELMEISGCPLVAFSSDVLEREDGNRITKDDFFQIYSTWCLKKDRPRLTKTKLTQQLPKYCNYIIGGKDKDRVWLNVKIKPSWRKASEVSENNDNIKNLDTSDTYSHFIRPEKVEDILPNNKDMDMGYIKSKKASEVSKQLNSKKIELVKKTLEKISICPKCSGGMIGNKCVGCTADGSK